MSFDTCSTLGAGLLQLLEQALLILTHHLELFLGSPPLMEHLVLVVYVPSWRRPRRCR